MTALVSRPPLQVLSPSAMQVGSRRLSTRLQEKDHAPLTQHGASAGGVNLRQAEKSQGGDAAGGKKRKNGYEEDDDGFSFTRVTRNKKPRQARDDAVAEPVSTPRKATKEVEPVLRQPAPPKSRNATPPRSLPSSTARQDGSEVTVLQKKKRKKMSFSTPKAKEQQQPLRRSKRLSSEATQSGSSPALGAAEMEIVSRKRRQPSEREEKLGELSQQRSDQHKDFVESQAPESENVSVTAHSATKIALPFADTPVIRRNKAMREGKGSKGERRSSLGLRGRRASSLIETGNSNALPHQEVGVSDFYKHIESDLMEPRRMRQLLTWCATRAMHAKPIGTDFEDASAKSAVRVIEEELLKELSNKSELSDWFSREDVPTAPKILPERPNPKNVQNSQKIAELEEQINRLKKERDGLQALLQPPDIPKHVISNAHAPNVTNIDRTLLSDEDAALLDEVGISSSIGSKEVFKRINEIASSIGPSIDTFADGIHKIAQYRSATDKIASKVLSICAERLADREKAGRRKALHTNEDRSPGRDLGNVLRGLSRVER